MAHPPPSSPNVFPMDPRRPKISPYNIISSMISTIEAIIGNLGKIPRDTVSNIEAMLYQLYKDIFPIMAKWEKIIRLGVEPEKIFRVISNIYQSLRDSGLTLHNIDVNVERDLEIPSWEYVVIRLYVDGDFEEVDRFWTKISRDAYKILGEQAKKVFILVE